MTPCVALLRGVNVGGAKRVPMADLRTLIEGLAIWRCARCSTAANAVFMAKGSDAGKIAQALSRAIEKKFGFSVAVVVVTAPMLAAIIKENPFAKTATDPRGTWSPSSPAARSSRRRSRS
jgi:uncharacterized protein (DUF1697 family)